MKRILMLGVAVCVTLGAVTSVAAAAPARSNRSATVGMSTTITWTAEYNAEAYYGEVKCTGKTVVSKKFPGGRDVENCEAVSGTLAHMHAGKGQKEFENSEGGSVSEWESDSGDGKRTTNYSYKVSKNLKRFRLVAIYPES